MISGKIGERASIQYDEAWPVVTKVGAGKVLPFLGTVSGNVPPCAKKALTIDAWAVLQALPQVSVISDWSIVGPCTTTLLDIVPAICRLFPAYEHEVL